MSVGGVSPQAGEESHSGGLKKKGLSGEDRPEDQGTGHTGLERTRDWTFEQWYYLGSVLRAGWGAGGPS